MMFWKTVLGLAPANADQLSKHGYIYKPFLAAVNRIKTREQTKSHKLQIVTIELVNGNNV